MSIVNTYPAAGAVLERPSLNGTTLRLSHDARLGSIRPGDTVDLPLAACALELERMIHALLVRGEGDIAECGRECFVSVVVFDGIADHKAHDFVCVKVRIDIGDLGVRLERDILVLEGAEVNDDFPALGHRNVKLGGINRLGEKTCVGTHNLQRFVSAQCLGHVHSH